VQDDDRAWSPESKKTITIKSRLIADFTAYPTTTTSAVLTVNFTDRSEGDIAHWYWDLVTGQRAQSVIPPTNMLTLAVLEQRHVSR